MKKKEFLIIAFCLLLFSCNKNDGDSKIGLYDVTGVNLFDEIGIPKGRYGSPNDFSVGEYVLVDEALEQGVTSDGGSLTVRELPDDNVSFYPNPIRSVLHIKFNRGIDNIWVLKGNLVEAQEYDSFQDDYFSEEYELEYIKSIPNLMHFNSIDSELKINFSDLENGLYKVFIESNGKLFWKSVHKAGFSYENYESNSYWK